MNNTPEKRTQKKSERSLDWRAALHARERRTGLISVLAAGAVGIALLIVDPQDKKPVSGPEIAREGSAGAASSNMPTEQPPISDRNPVTHRPDDVADETIASQRNPYPTPPYVTTAPNGVSTPTE